MFDCCCRCSLLLRWSGCCAFFSQRSESLSSVSRIFSVTTASAVAVFLAALLIHFHGFGGYTNVVTTSLLLNAWSQILIVIAILFAVATGTENVYTLPEFSVPGDDPDAPAAHLRTSDIHVGSGDVVRRRSGLPDAVVSEIDGAYARGKGRGKARLTIVIGHQSFVIWLE